jgi:hypothetical protein
MKKLLVFVLIIAANLPIVHAQSKMKDHDILQSESNNLLLLSAGIMNLSFKLGAKTPDGLKLQTAGVVVGRYIFDISGILSLYAIYSKMADQSDKKLVEDQISFSLRFLGARLATEKRPVLGEPLIDPLEFDSYQARKEVAAALDQLEYLSSRLDSMANRGPE